MKSSGKRWILIVIGLLVGNVAMMGVLIGASTSSRPAIIPAYYERAVAFDGELAAAEASRALGWQVKATIGAGRLVVTARDAHDRVITGARVRVLGVPRARATARFEVELDAAGDRYQIDHAGPRGVHDLEVVIERGGERFVARLVAEAT